MYTSAPRLTADPPDVRITLLGGFRVECHDGDGPAEVRPASSGRRLLALLAVHGPTTRAVAATRLWPDATDCRAQGSLRTTLWRLHRVAGNLVDVDGDRLALGRRVRVDLHTFTAEARRLLDLDPDGDLDAPPASVVLGGELLPGWSEEWVLVEREQLRQLGLHAVEAMGWQLARRGRYSAAIEAGLAAIRLDPLRESAHRLLISVHLSEHNVAEAARLLSSFRRLLSHELGVEPSPELTALLPARTVARRPDLTLQLD